MSFRTQFDDHPRVYQDPGAPTKPHYQSRINVRGNLELVVDGVVDLYADIQSHADSVDIHLILERFTAGETDILSKVQGFYADFADMPSTMQEVLNSIIAGEAAFDRLPVEIKDRFGHSFQRWMMEMDSPDFAAKMGYTPEQEAAIADIVADSRAKKAVVVQPAVGDATAPPPQGDERA